MKVAEDREAVARDASGSDTGLGDLPFLPPADGAVSPPGSSSTTTTTPTSTSSADGSSSRQADADEQAWIDAARSSVLASQVQSAAHLMGHDVSVPALPIDELPAENPLAFAIAAWIAATGSQVPPDELQAQILRANALPMGLQRDLALLILSAADATTLQHAALARLTPEEVAWIYTHPEVAERLANGIEDPETRYLAILSGGVDMAKSIQASLLLLAAIDATRGSLEAAGAQGALAALQSPDLDPTTSALLALIIQEATTAVSDQEKVRFAARLVATTAGIPLPESPAPTTFDAAVADLLRASGQSADAAELAAVLDRASALPVDLQTALAGVLAAEARSIDASNPSLYTPDGQSMALAGMLVAVADALPTLEKYNLYWRNAPEALRVTQWTPQARAGWAAEHAALLVSTRGDPADLVRAASIAGGAGLVPAEYPQLSLLDAYVGLAQLAGASTNATVRAQVAQAAENLDPALRDAAAIMLSGALQSALLQREAFQELSAEEKAWLLTDAVGIDALYFKSDLTADELQTLARASLLAERVDQTALATASAVATRATLDAREVLEGAGAFGAQGHATPVDAGFFAFLKRLLPFGAASAQQIPAEACDAFIFGDQTTCDQDIILQVPFFQLTGAGDAPMRCKDGTCMQESGTINTYALVITGNRGTEHQRTTNFERNFDGRQRCPEDQRFGGGFCDFMKPRTFEDVPQYGAPTVSIDLGGDDQYLMPVAVTLSRSPVPVSLHLEVAGDDQYTDPSALYDEEHSFTYFYGSLMGHPTEGSAFEGGVAVLVDASGSDVYQAATRSQGFGRYGAGVLADLGGSVDSYSATEVSQGASSDTFNLGVGALVDSGGDDIYDVESGQGYGLGGVLLDAGGRDSYSNAAGPALGVPLVHLDIIPGGDVTTLDVRGDNRVWLDGPGSLNPGLAIDTEVVLTAGDTDGDGFGDFAEFAVGNDPNDPRDSPSNHATARVDLVLNDADGDGYPDYVERILSTDAEDPTEFPVGFPTGVVIVLPQSVVEALDDTLLGTNQLLTSLGVVYDDGAIDVADLYRDQNMSRSDKILDLRLPLQDAGSIEPACAPVFFNATSPASADTGLFGLTSLADIPYFLYPVVASQVTNTEDPQPPFPQPSTTIEGALPAGGNALSGANQQDFKPKDDGSPASACLSFGYSTASPGEGNATAPDDGFGPGSSYTFRLPAGILAIGDLVDSSYDVDYFLVVDLGGDDVFSTSAGGGLLVATRPATTGTVSQSDAPKVSAFLAPSLVVNVDVAEATGVMPAPTMGGSDVYANASRSYAHGSLGGVLVDTTGDDDYVANAGSQGALGGVLLDLAGSDTYYAGNLSQGASVGGTPPGGRADMPDGATNIPQSGANNNATGDAPVRRLTPGLLADLGDDTAERDLYVAGSNSQGFGRAFNLAATGANSPARNAVSASGILLDLAGRDAYNAQQLRGRNSQGVAGMGGLGLLADLDGIDAYTAYGVVSQGATISQIVGTGEARPTVPIPAAGILLDLAEDISSASDSYGVLDVYGRAVDRRTRNTNLTVTRSETTTAPPTGANAGRVYADLGIHLDGTRDADILDGVGGVGSGKHAVDDHGFLVDLPSARLAIGSDEDTKFEREYALAIDVGGANTYSYTAGGFIADVLVATQTQSQNTPVTSGGLAPSPTIYPVTLVLDGNGTSVFKTGRSFAQGAAFFSVGILADIGGADTFEVVPEPLPVVRNSWMSFDAPIDGVVGSDWDGVAQRTIELVKVRETSNATPWTMRIANDEDSLYLALEGRTTSATEAERILDTLTVDLDMGHRGKMWDFDAARTGVDQVSIAFTKTGTCTARDRGLDIEEFNDSKTATTWPNDHFAVDAARAEAAVADMEVACRVSETGEVTVEIRKLLVENNPRDPWDLGYRYNETEGWLYTVRDGSKSVPAGPANELGLFLRFNDAGISPDRSASSTATWTVWPAGATDVDGDYGFRRGDLADEMATWAVVSLARNGQPGSDVAPTRAPVFAQGSGFSGVGILAMLGGAESSSTLTAYDMAQGYGAFGGLGMMIDLAGSDTYAARERAQGAGENAGLGLLIEADGHDNYRLGNLGYGWAHSTSNGGAFFLDLGGDDEYTWLGAKRGCVAAAPTCSQDVSILADASPYRNDAVTQQNSSGVFVDSHLTDLVYGNVRNLIGNVPPNLELYRYAEASEDQDAGCTASDLPVVPGTITPEDPDGTPLASGMICLHTRVDMSGLLDTLNTTSGSQLRVVGMEFAVDRTRVATLKEPTVSEEGGRVTEWEIVIDTSAFRDGAKRVKAIPLVAIEQDGRQQLVYRSAPNVGEFNESAWIEPSVFDNAPSIGLRVSPAYSGVANATFSPYAIGGKKELAINWTVSHDANEERLNAYNGYAAPASQMNFPCVRDGEQLCHVLPFYLPSGQADTLQTRPGSQLVGASAVPETDGSSYARNTEVFGTALRIQRQDSIHVALPGRTNLSLFEQNITTTIKLYVEDENGAPVEDAHGDTWYINASSFKEPTGLAPINVLDSVLGASSGLGPQLRAPFTTADQTASDPISTIVRTAVGAACGPSINPAACDQFSGRWGANAARLCGDQGSTNILTSTSSRVGWTAQNTINGTSPVVFCGERLDDQLIVAGQPVDGAFNGLGIGSRVNDTGQDNLDLIDPPAEDEEETEPGAPAEAGSLPRGWNDFYLNVNTTLPPADNDPATEDIRFEGGALVIPAGYRIQFVMETRTDGLRQVPVDITGTTRDPLVGIANTLEDADQGQIQPIVDSITDDERCLDGTQDVAEGRCVPLTLVSLRTAIGFIRNQRAIESLDDTKDLRSLPLAFFRVGGGAPEEQPRVELRVPAEPSTDARITLDRINGEGNFETVYEFASGTVEGDVLGTPTRDGFRLIAGRTTMSNYVVANGERFTQRSVTLLDDVVADGVYYVTIEAKDESARSELRAPSIRRETVIVDKTPPATTITTDEFAGSALVEGGRIPIKWIVNTAGAENAPGTGLANTTFLYYVGDDDGKSELANWHIKWHDTNSIPRDFIPKGDSNVYLAMAISLDEAGNLEGFTSDTATSATFSEAFAQAFRAKLERGDATGGYRRIVVDQGRPVALAVPPIQGGRLLSYLGSEFAFVRAGAPVSFSICVVDLDEEGAIGLVRLGLDHLDPATQKLVAASFDARATGSCGSGDRSGTLYTYSDWDSVNTNRTSFPEGIWVAQFEVFDRAGNRIRVAGGSVVLDHDAPTVVPQAPILPLGQSAVKPGDKVTLRLLATDAFGVDQAGIRIDASKLTTDASLKTTPKPVDGVVYQEATFTVNRTNLQNQIYTVTAKVPDNAGNVTTVEFHVPVDFKKFTYVPDTLEVTNVTHNSVVLRWETTENTSAGARYGLTTNAIDKRTPLNATATKEHALLVENLVPSTRYYFRVVSTSPSGYTLESDVLEAETSTALFLTNLAPATGARVSGAAPISWEGGLLDSNGFVTYTVEVQSAADKPWTFLTTLTRQGDEHKVSWNTTRFLDGTAYRYRVTATAGKDVAAQTIGPITLDNTPPSVTVLSPLLATNDTTPRIVAEARDSLSGLQPGSAMLFVDGIAVDGIGSDALPDGGIRVAYEIPTPLAAGQRTFELRVSDRAGATAREIWKVSIDGDAPNATQNPTRFAPGTAAAKLGGTATINLTIKDASGVAAAVADVSQLNSELRSARLVKLVGTDSWQLTIPVLAADEGAVKDVLVTMTDLAGNTNVATVRVPVDNVAPIVPAASVSGITHTSAFIDAAAENEPVLLSVTATSPATSPATAATRDAAKSARVKVDGLFPSRTYTYQIVATDLAGNAVTLAGSFPTLVDAKPPTQVGPLSVLDLLNGTLRLSWTAARDDVAVDFYRVYRSDGGAFAPIAEVDGTSYDDANLPLEKFYTYKVAAVDYGNNEGPAEERLRAAATAVPSLDAGLASPTVGSILTTFRYTVSYVSPGGISPATIRIILDGVPQDMKLLSGDPKTGAIYVYETRLAPHKRDEPHTYAFEASDGRYTVRFPQDGSVLRGPLVSADTAGATDAGAFAAFAQNVPGGGAALTGFALVGAVVAAALIMRRKKEGSK